MSYLIDIEDAMIAKILGAKQPAPKSAVNVFNVADVYRGEKDEKFLAVIRESAPCAFLFLDRSFTKAREFFNADASGHEILEGTTEDNEMLVWSVLVGAKSLRATKELSHGGPGVYGAYELIDILRGPGATPGQIRGWAPLAQAEGQPYAEPFVFIGLELLGQTTTAAVYELQFRTRVQLT
jgi:hypothetical protein